MPGVINTMIAVAGMLTGASGALLFRVGRVTSMVMIVIRTVRLWSVVVFGVHQCLHSLIV